MVKSVVRSAGLALVFTAALAAAPALADVKAGVDAWTKGDYPAAVAQWREPATRGDADAQFNMGQAYKLGRGVPMDLTIALDWYRKAATQGHLQASDNLGLVLFQQGKRDEAMPFLEKSANRGEPRSQYVVGTAAFNGDIVKKDWVRAYALMTRASAQGLPQASRSLAQMDKYLNAEQKAQGIAMAGQLEKQATVAKGEALAGATIPAAPSPAPAARPTPPARPAAPAVKPVEVPPSQASGYDIPGYTPSVPAASGSAPTPAPVRPAPAPKPAPAAPTVAASGDWRVQIGAFSDQAKAKALWNSLESRSATLKGWQPYIVPAGNVVRLQAGPFASSAEANRACATFKSLGQACFAVKK